LELVHIQLGELWANVKQARRNLWVLVACDATTKIIPVMQVGARTQEMAYAIVHELKLRLKAGSVPVFSSDGLKHYFYALTAHFGEWIILEGERKAVWMILPEFLYRQVLKSRRRHRMVNVEQRMLWSLPTEYSMRLKASYLRGRLNTAFVEWVNLTIRQSVSKLTRCS
jgi:transposase-like protein